MTHFMTITTDGSRVTICGRWANGADVEVTIDHAVTSDADWPAARDAAVQATGVDAFILNAQRSAWLGSVNGLRRPRTVTAAAVE